MPAAPIATLPTDDYALEGNTWAIVLALPATDDAANPLSYGAFSVSTTDGRAVTVTPVLDGSAVTLTLSAADLTPGDFTWYVTESAVFAGNAFMRGTVHVVARSRAMSGPSPSSETRTITVNVGSGQDRAITVSVGAHAGPIGPPGRQGDPGEPGAPGADGRDGTDGAAGDPGPQGDRGPAGRDGLDGTPGAPGRDGVNGADGARGPQGEQGLQGVPGQPGADGARGAKGDTGDPGPQGVPGSPGSPGAPGTPAPLLLPSGMTGSGRYDWITHTYTPSNFAGHPKLRAALARSAAGVGRAKIAVIGPSTTAGYVGSGHANVRGASDYPFRLANELAGLGYEVSEPAFSHIDQISPDLIRTGFSGVWSWTTQPSQSVFPVLQSGATGTWKAKRPGTAIDIWVSANSGASGPVVDGAIPTSVAVSHGTWASSQFIAPDGTANAWTKATISGLARKPHSLTLTTVTAAALGVVDIYSPTGVSIANFGSSSSRTADWNAAPAFSLLDNVIQWAPDHTIIDLGLFFNSWQQTSPAESFATGIANLEAAIALLQAAGSEVSLIGIGPAVSPTKGETTDALYQTFFTLADALGLLFMDQRAPMGGSASAANALGLYGGADQVHLSATGYTAIAQRIPASLGLSRAGVAVTAAPRTARATFRQNAQAIVQGTWARQQANTSYDGGSIGNTASNAVGDGLVYDIDLTQGTWSFVVYGFHGPAYGIVTFDLSFDGGTTWTTVGTKDYYNATLASDASATFTGIAVPSTGPALFRFRVLSRNASNTTGFTFSWTAVEANRTDTLI